MPKEDNKQRDIVRRARERARDGATYWSENWENARDDLDVLSGNQWPDDVITEREDEGRPCLTNNVLPTFVDQVIGDQRQNRPSIKVSARNIVRVNRDDGQDGDLKISNVDGQKQYALAEVMEGVVKSIECESDADTAYDAAFQSAVESSMGYLRVRTDWNEEDVDDWDQNIVIEAIENQFAVTMDPGAKKRDFSDSAWMILDDNIEKSVFEELYPNASTEPLDDNMESSWFGEHTVRVSEYFERVPYTCEVLLLSDGRTVKYEEVKGVLDELAEQGITVVRRRKVKKYKVIWYKITGNEVLEGPKETVFSTIPIVPVFGKMIRIKNKRIYRSIIRNSKDSQRMLNYWDSAATEAVALAPKAPFVGATEHFEGHPEWDTANTKNHSKLTFNPLFPGDTGPRREAPSSVPAAEITLGQQSIDKIKSTLGLYDASLGASGPEISGRAIIARQRQGDRGTFTFIDNLSKSIERIGLLVVEAIPKVYDAERMSRIMFEDGTSDYVKLNEKIYDNESGEWVTIHDLSVAKYDVKVTTGPTYATQRMEAAEAMIQFAQAVPQAAGVMADLIAKNMDWPGADLIAERLRKIVPPNVLSPEERKAIEEDNPEPEGPTPDQQLAMMELDVKKSEIEADKMKAEADAMQAQADMLEAQLDTDDAKAKLKLIEQEAQDGVDNYQQVREMVAQAIAEIMATSRQPEVPVPNTGL